MSRILIYSTHLYTAAIKNCWRESPCELIEVHSVEELISSVNNDNFDLIVLDSDQEANITELASEVRRPDRNKNTGILFMIPGKIKYEFEFEGMENAPVIGISKPFSRPEVLNISKVLINNKKQYDNLTASYEEIEQFSVMASHDLKTPLKNIYSYADLLIDEVSSESFSREELLDFSKTILSESSRMLKMVDNIYDFSRAGESGVLIEGFSLKEMVENIFDRLQSKYPQKRLTSHLKEMPAIFKSDRTKLAQILELILDNSFKYSRDESVEICVEFQKLESGSVSIEIEDKSGGIDIDELDNVFKPLKRGRNNKSGAGIGLAIVKKLVDCLEGEVKVETFLGHGSRFTLSFYEHRKLSYEN